VGLYKLVDATTSYSLHQDPAFLANRYELLGHWYNQYPELRGAIEAALQDGELTYSEYDAVSAQLDAIHQREAQNDLVKAQFALQQKIEQARGEP
jgi:hypothetical protein